MEASSQCIRSGYIREADELRNHMSRVSEDPAELSSQQFFLIPPSFFEEVTFSSTLDSAESSGLISKSSAVETSCTFQPPRSRVAAKFSFKQDITKAPARNVDLYSLSAAEGKVPTEQSAEQSSKKKKKKKKKNSQQSIPSTEKTDNVPSSTKASECIPQTQVTSERLSHTPVGVFWDIENCQVPRGKSTLAIVELIRQTFMKEKREAEFLVVCDIHKESPRVVSDLNNGQVTVVHVACTSKNAADDKLRQCMWRFADNYGSSSTIICISSDVNFATDLSDMKNRRKMHVVLLHGKHAPEALLLCANETRNFYSLVEDLPVVHHTSPKRFTARETTLEIGNLPPLKSAYRVRQRLLQIMENCGGKVMTLQGASAVAQFPTPQATSRARTRMEGEDVFGNKIFVKYATRTTKGTTAAVLSSVSSVASSGIPGGFPPPPDPSRVPPPRLINMATSLNEPAVEDTFSRAAKEADGPGKYNYYRTPSEYLIEKTPQGYRRIRGASKGTPANQYNDETSSSRLASDRAAYIPYPLTTPATESTRPPMTPSPSSSNNSPSIPVDLHVTNLDQNLSTKEMKQLIAGVFKQHVSVLHVSVHTQGDGRLSAVVRVPSMQDAQYAVSQLHRRKLGNKRIMIAYDNSNPSSGRSTPSLQQLRAQVNAVLAEIPQRRLPLFKFRELFEQRFHSSISLADLHRLRDILQVTDDASGRSVVFLQRRLETPPTDNSHNYEQDGFSTCEPVRCGLHDPGRTGAGIGWAEPEPVADLPLVYSTVHQMEVDIHRLLQSHNGSVPLASVPFCYTAEIGHLDVDEDKGVPLEHLISCIKGIRIVTVSGHKRILWAGNPDSDSAQEPLQDQSPSLVPQISLFCRELVDLLKMAPQCRINFSKFIPAYHHHFGRQCRVADYGYTRLIDLLEALPHVVQVLGEGNRRYVTLSHRAQTRRFTSDLLRILKTLTNKQVSVSQFPFWYEKTLGRIFDPREYGICLLEDLVAQVAEASVVVVATEGGETVIALPRRDQTPEEMERTKQFALEAVELLRHAPLCRLPFSKFIPAYHHHFGRQCRVADYGCTKLIELFETIPDIVVVFENDSDGEKYVQLTTKQRLKILSHQVANLVKSQASQKMGVSELPEIFRRHYGFVLKPEAYEAVDHEDLVSKLRNTVKIVYTEKGAELMLVDPAMLEVMKRNIFKILYATPEGQMTIHKLLLIYRHEYDDSECPLTILSEHMDEYLTVDNDNYVEPVAKLVPLQMFSRQVHVLLLENDRRLMLMDFEAAFLERFGTPCQPGLFGQPNAALLLQAIPQTVLLRGKGTRRVLILNRETCDLVPPLLPKAKTKPNEIKPPAHWLETPVSRIQSRNDEDSASVKSILFDSGASSPMTVAPFPSMLSFPWGTMWSMGMTVGLAVGISPVSNGLNLQPLWNSNSAVPEYRCNYWLTPIPWPYGMPSYQNLPEVSSSRASIQEIEEIPKAATPPPASLVPLPLLLTPPVTNSEDEEVKVGPRRRLAAQFSNKFPV